MTCPSSTSRATVFPCTDARCWIRTFSVARSSTLSLGMTSSRPTGRPCPVHSDGAGRSSTVSRMIENRSGAPGGGFLGLVESFPGKLLEPAGQLETNVKKLGARRRPDLDKERFRLAVDHPTPELRPDISQVIALAASFLDLFQGFASLLFSSTGRRRRPPRPDSLSEP